jgi:hypothetical protein
MLAVATIKKLGQYAGIAHNEPRQTLEGKIAPPQT